MRELPVSEYLCDEPREAAEYWRQHVTSHPFFNRDTECGWALDLARGGIVRTGPRFSSDTQARTHVLDIAFERDAALASDGPGYVPLCRRAVEVIFQNVSVRQSA